MKYYNEIDYWSKNKNPNSSSKANTIKHGLYIRNKLIGQENVLDFGTGVGRLMEYYKSVNKLTGYDISSIYKEQLLANVKKHNINFSLVIDKEIRDVLPFDDAEFDTVTAVSVFLHQRPINISRLMRELARVGDKVAAITYMDTNISFTNHNNFKKLFTSTNNFNSFNYDYKTICRDNDLKIIDWNYDKKEKQLYFEFKHDRSKNNLIFIHIGKTGGTSISRVLNFKYVDETKYYKQNGKLYERRHIPAIDIMSYIGDDWGKFYKFSVVRNPWDKAVSQYHYQSKKGIFKRENIDINSWVKLAYIDKDSRFHKSKMHFENQVNYLIDKSGNIIVDRVLRFENLNNDFENMCNDLKISRVSLPHINRTKHKHYSEILNSKSVKIISNAYAKDIMLFKYEFGV